MDDAFVTCGRQGLPVNDCLVVDAHAHIGAECPTVPLVDPRTDTLIRVMDRLGIDRVYASAYEAVFGEYRMGNDLVIEATRCHPDRIRGYMVLTPGQPQTIQPEMERCYAAGLRAVKMFSYGIRSGLRYDHPNYERIFDQANQWRLPILAHTWQDEMQQLEPMFKKYPHSNWILAHAGRDVATYARLARDYPNVFLETCFSPCPRGLLETLVRLSSPEKVVWGSDQTSLSPAVQLGRVLFARLAPEHKAAILGRNAQRALEGTTPEVINDDANAHA
jgi:predicted TIM-barrel fold metal-dependent hydrolase